MNCKNNNLLLFPLLFLNDITEAHLEGEAGRGCAFHFVEIFRFVEMQSVFFYIFRMGWNFLIKCCSSDPSFNRNILRSLYLKFKASAHAHIVIAYYYTLFTNFLR